MLPSGSSGSVAAGGASGSSGMAWSPMAKCTHSDASKSIAWPRAAGFAFGWRATCSARCSRYSRAPDLAM
eukprot:scaffold89534_cov27-Tisochrysis_lutea.AAC.3